MSGSGPDGRRVLRHGRSMALWLAALSAALGGTAVHADEFEVALGVSSRTVLRGVLLGDLTLRTSASYQRAPGWSADLGVAAMQSPARHEQWDPQLSPKLGYTRLVGADWAWQSAYAHHAYPGSQRLRRYAHHELSTTLAYRDRLYLSLAALRNVHALSESRTSVAYEVVASQPLAAGFGATAGIGYRDALHVSADHAYGHAGINLRWRQAQADLLYIATDSAAKRRLGPAADNRWVASVTWTF